MKPPHRARSLGSPSALSRAGSTTALTNRLDASSIVASWSSSLEPKWPKRPLLLISRSLARRLIVNPSRPSIDARSTARSRMAARVRLGWRPLPLLWAAVGVTVPILPACRTNVRALQSPRSSRHTIEGGASARLRGEEDRRHGGHLPWGVQARESGAGHQLVRDAGDGHPGRSGAVPGARPFRGRPGRGVPGASRLGGDRNRG